jgi:hypothetical protein
VDVGWQALSLTPSWCKERTILVRATDAIRLCRESGYEELPRMRAWEQLDGLRRQDMGRVRNFVSRARLTGFPLSSFEDGAVLALLRGAIKNQDLVLVRGGAGAGKAPERTTAEQRRLIARIEAKTRDRLSYLGRQYKLVADVDLSKTPQRDSYEVVRREDAIQVLDGLATQMGSSPDLPPLLAKAREKLTADWRPPLSPDGLILLRRIKSLAAAQLDTEAPITPSQMKALIQPDVTFEVIVLGMDDKPIKDIQFTIEAPDGEDYDGSLGSAGKTNIKSSKTGAAGVTLSWKRPEQ